MDGGLPEVVEDVIAEFDPGVVNTQAELNALFTDGALVTSQNVYEALKFFWSHRLDTSHTRDDAFYDDITDNNYLDITDHDANNIYFNASVTQIVELDGDTLDIRCETIAYAPNEDHIQGLICNDLSWADSTQAVLRGGYFEVEGNIESPVVYLSLIHISEPTRPY